MAMNYIDMHCDTLLKTLGGSSLYENPRNMLDVARMVSAGQGAQFFAVFFPPVPDPDDAPPVQNSWLLSDDQLFEQARQNLLDTVSAHGDVIGMAYTVDDIERHIAAGRCAAVLTMEDARAVNGEMAKLRYFYDAGVRAMSLTWNAANCFGHPNTADAAKMQLGLTDFGKQAMTEMNALGIIVDVSHLSDGGFWDVAALSAKPFAATHSNCRALCAHPRNLSDEMIRALADKGGVAGVNFAPQFLAPDAGDESRVEDICRHVLHFIKIGGEDCVGLGSDFDGIGGALEVGEPGQMHQIFDRLANKGVSARQMEKFTHGNVLRVFRDCCG